jgi:hypothetical protein
MQMDISTKIKKIKEFETDGFAVLPEIYTQPEIDELRKLFDSYCGKMNQAAPVHAIRRPVEKIPELNDLLWSEKMKQCLTNFAGANYFLTKSIYFDKPEASNWFVAYHQDLSISVNEKKDTNGYKNWTNKKDQVGVQPPISILENPFTIRIHLDDTDQANGALRLVPGSHKNGVVRIQDISTETEVLCKVPAGGIMLMKPLTFHALSRSTENKKRRVLHLEFNNQALEKPLCWSEKQMFLQKERR